MDADTPPSQHRHGRELERPRRATTGSPTQTATTGRSPPTARPSSPPPGWHPADRVLDVGCGTGAMTRAAARQAGTGSALGVDIGRPMVEEARAEAAADGGLPTSRSSRPTPRSTRSAPAASTWCSAGSASCSSTTRPPRSPTSGGPPPTGGRLAFASWHPVVANDWILVPICALVEHLGMPDICPARTPPARSRSTTPTACGRCCTAAGSPSVDAGRGHAPHVDRHRPRRRGRVHARASRWP